MIIVITNREWNDRTGKYETIVSHGIDEDTLKNVVLPQERPVDIGAKFDKDLNEWVLE
jgi:hypothetical protein